MRKIILVNIIILFFTNMSIIGGTSVPIVKKNLSETRNITIESLKMHVYQREVNPFLNFDVVFRYDGDQALYYAYANQLVREHDRLYHGFYDWEKWIALLKKSVMIFGDIQTISYDLIKLDNQTNQFFYALPLASGFIFEDLDTIEEITFILYLFDESDIKDIGYRRDYIELLESGKGQRVEIRTRNIEIVQHS